MEAAGRVFEDWEFRVLESEAGVEEEEREGKIEGKERGNEEDKEKEISCQKHAVYSAQVSQGRQIKDDNISENLTSPSRFYWFG